MWDKTKRQRFSTLREIERQGALTPEEQTELHGLYRHLEEMEASYLLPGIERKRHETEKLRAINEALRDVIRRKEEHLTRMQGTLAQFRMEREALNAELERILAQAAEAEVASWSALNNVKRCGGSTTAIIISPRLRNASSILSVITFQNISLSRKTAHSMR
jgi:branched-subunit amino acid aminotransferase/4-amino-4-deoxychorismate lyase